MVEISEYYITNKGKLNFEYDKIEVNNRPAWIRVLDIDKSIKFLKVNTKSGRFFYTSFIENYYLVEDASNEEISNFYNEISVIYNKKMQSHRQIGNFIANNLKTRFKNTISVLSICSGSGIEMIKLLEEGFSNITLLDVSKNMIDIAKNDEKFAHCQFIVSDFLKANFKKKKYDVVLCSMGIHYFSGNSLKNFLNKCKYILKENGEIHIININIPLNELNNYFETVQLKDYEIIDENKKKTRVIYYVGKLKK